VQMSFTAWARRPGMALQTSILSTADVQETHYLYRYRVARYYR
jgi:hypothetical protein